jgi:hypothetical protein
MLIDAGTAADSFSVPRTATMTSSLLTSGTLYADVLLHPSFPRLTSLGSSSYKSRPYSGQKTLVLGCAATRHPGANLHLCCFIWSRLRSYTISQSGTAPALNQHCSAIYHHRLPRAESFLHQKQIGLRYVMSLPDSANRETLSHAFV